MNVGRVVDIGLLLCAVVVTGLLVHSELRGPEAVNTVDLAEAKAVDNWRELLAAGHQFGAKDAAVSIVVFSDFQCPFCRALHESIQAVRAEFGDEILVTYLHYPLSYHREAIPAALASECASKEGRFEQFSDAVFASQDSLGLLSWEALAGRSGIAAVLPFVNCVKAMKDHPRISSGKQLGKSLGVTGTPTVLVNGWLLPVVPSRDELRRMVRELLSGKTLPLVLS